MGSSRPIRAVVALVAAAVPLSVFTTVTHAGQAASLNVDATCKSVKVTATDSEDHFLARTGSGQLDFFILSFKPGGGIVETLLVQAPWTWDSNGSPTQQLIGTAPGSKFATQAGNGWRVRLHEDSTIEMIFTFPAECLIPTESPTPTPTPTESSTAASEALAASPAASSSPVAAMAQTGGFDFRFPLAGLSLLVAGLALLLVSVSRGGRSAHDR
jgi:hypothetical protein